MIHWSLSSHDRNVSFLDEFFCCTVRLESRKSVEPFSEIEMTARRNPFSGILSQRTKVEVRQLFTLAWPTILSYFLHNTLFTISLLFAGRLGEAELAASALSLSYIAVSGTFVGAGLVTAIEVLCAQAYGAKNYRLVGIMLQRGIWVLGIAVLLVWAVWMNTDVLLLLMKQESEVARLSQLFIFIWFPALIADFVFVLLQRYLQTQGIVRPMFYIGAVANVLHVGLNFLLIQGLGLGFTGVALASCLTYCLFFAAATILYMLCFKLYKKTWPTEGWTTESLEDWGQFSMLAVPGMLMLCIEWWSFEAGSFLMGTFGEIQLGAHGILMQLCTVVYMIPMGLSIAASVRVGNALGAGDHVSAKHVMKVSIVIIWCIAAVFSALLIGLKDYLGIAFSDNSEVVRLVSQVTPAMSGFSFFLSAQAVCCGIIRGCGRPKLGMLINFLFYDCVALPLGIVLAFYVFDGVEGFWWGLTAGIAPQTITYILILWCMDWSKQAELAQKRIAAQRSTSPLSWSTGNERGEDGTLVTSWLSRTSSLYSVNTNTLRGMKTPPNPVVSWIYNSSSLLSLNSAPMRAMHKPTLLEDEPTDSEDIDEHQLSNNGVKMTSQEKRSLVLRRLVWLLLALLVLLAAVAVRFFVPLPSSESHMKGSVSNVTCTNATIVLANLTSCT